ncbi:MAG: hypothetical protein EKK41_20610 [Hyphomicrobiales bacterium]|nr:MAG: hypothetical protein EKK41_20610 [Hyphomicrobiales bacterium]
MGSMIVFTRNGKTTVLTGWKAWLLSAVAFVATWAILCLIAALVIGVGLTIGVFLLLAIPALVGVGLVASAFGRR